MMKFAVNLKQKSILFVIVTSLLAFGITGLLFKFFYIEFHKNYLGKEVINLLEYTASDGDIDESIDWIANEFNMTIYKFENIEALSAAFPDNRIYQKEVIPLSDRDRQRLEEGGFIVKDEEALLGDLEFDILLFFYPIMENGIFQSLLFTYKPISNISEQFISFMLLMIFLSFVVVGSAYRVGEKSFRKTYNQLQDIKRAATEVSKGNYDTKVWQNSDDEIGEISNVFNQMSIALKSDQERMKEFIEDISHEIKTPLTYIKTYNMALLDGTIQDPNEQCKSFRLIDRETTRLQKLIQNFLDFTKLDACAVELNKQPIVFAQCIEDIMIKYEPIFHKQKIQFSMTLDYDVIIEGDEERIEQIIQNIVQNAIRYTKENPCIELTMEKQDKMCVLAISDNGVGISEEHLAVITNRFVRVKKVRSRKESGTGIGLSIVEKLVSLHGGEMMIESELGVGTTFKFKFPCVEI